MYASIPVSSGEGMRTALHFGLLNSKMARVHMLTEYAPGGDLDKAFIRQVGPSWSVWFSDEGVRGARRERKLRMLLNVARDTLAGLAFIHSKGYIHHDIKPANILLANDASSKCIDELSCRYVIADLGLASKLGKLGYTETTAGTAGYKGPEHSKKPLEIRASADIFALGTTLSELFCGTRTCASKDASERKVERYGAFPDLLKEMLSEEQGERPNAADALRRVNKIISEKLPEAEGGNIVAEGDKIRDEIEQCLATKKA